MCTAFATSDIQSPGFNSIEYLTFEKKSVSVEASNRYTNMEINDASFGWPLQQSIAMTNMVD